MFLISPVQAQEILPSLPQFPSPVDEPNELEPGQIQVPQIDPIVVPAGEEQSVFEGIDNIFIRSISFEGNQVFSDEQIFSVVEEFTKRSLSANDFEELEEKIRELYQKNGYLFSGGFITPESVAIGNQFDLKIIINEAKIYSITVVGAGRLNSYIRSQLSSLNDKVFNSNDVYNKMRFLLDEERIDDLQLDIIQNPEIEQKELVFNAKVDKSIKFTTTVNNGRSPSVGTLERGATIDYSNFLESGDRFLINYRNTDGSNIVAVDYDIPVNSSGGELELNYLYGDAMIVRDELEEFDIRGETQVFSIGFSQPVVRRSTNSMLQELSLGIRASHLRNNDSILGIPFPTTEGDNDKGKLHSTKISFNQNYIYKTRRNYLLLGSEFAFGPGIGTVNAEEFGDGNFFKWTGQALYSQQFDNRFRTISFVNIQVADRDLIGNEQFSLGGRGSVRAFSTNQLSRSNGGHIIQEARYAVYRQNDNQVELSVFFDFGAAWNNQKQLLEQDEFMAGMGFGVSYIFANLLRANLEFAFPFFGPEPTTESLQDKGLRLDLQFFF